MLEVFYAHALSVVTVMRRSLEGRFVIPVCNCGSPLYLASNMRSCIFLVVAVWVVAQLADTVSVVFA